APDARWKRTDSARWLPSRCTSTDSTALPRPRAAARRVEEKLYGPQSWCGEYVSYGSGTERRYGIGADPCHASCTASVRPPELESPGVRAAVEGERRAGAVEDGDRAEGEACAVAPDGEDEPRPDAVRPGRQRSRETPPVGDPDRRGATHRDGRRPLREQDAN